MITTGPVEAFFKPPADPPSDTGDCLLYHLRSDLELLYGAEGGSIPISPSHTLLATMGVLCGIDYLSQAYSTLAGDRKRFVETVQNLAHLSEEESEVLYQLRCVLVHQIGLSGVNKSYRKSNEIHLRNH